MPVFMFLLVLALPAAVVVAVETEPDPPKLCQHYNVHEGRMIEGPCSK